MTAVMILILFLINVLLIFAIILLFMRQNRLLEVEKKQRDLLSEAEELVSGLLAEMREENDRFLQQLVHARKMDEKPGQNTSYNNRADKPEDVIEGGLSEEAIDSTEETIDITEETFDRVEETENAQEEQSLRNQVEAMAAQGMTMTEIAKALGKGKTEIELAMKFYQQA